MPVKMTEIKFDAPTNSLGRNGVLSTTGIHVSECSGDDYVTVFPITSKGALGRCRIEIPKAKWAGAALEALVAKEELRHLLLGIHPLLDEMLEHPLKGDAH